MFANEFFITKVHRHARAIAIPASEFHGGSRSSIPADKAEGNHASLKPGRCHFVVVKIEERLIGVDQGDVLPSIAIIVQDGEPPAVRRLSNPDGAEISAAAAAIGEVMVA
jgi:hypothetical protein